MISAAAIPGVASRQIQFHWVLDRRRDLIFYIGSALAGWAYVAVILFALGDARTHAARRRRVAYARA